MKFLVGIRKIGSLCSNVVESEVWNLKKKLQIHAALISLKGKRILLIS